jgi:CRP-like cAMP-binding protein
MPVSLQLLAQFSLLRPLSREALEQLSTKMTLRSFARRAMVLSKDSSTQELGFLIDGRLQGIDVTVGGRTVGLYFVEPGDYFGELSVVDGKPGSEYIVAAAPSTVAFLEPKEANALISMNYELARAVLERLAGRVRGATAQRMLLSLANPFQRLCVQLLQLSHQSALGAQTVDPVPTHQELAIMINSSRETVTRAFQMLFSKRILSRDGNTLTLVCMKSMKNIAEGLEEPPK